MYVLRSICLSDNQSISIPDVNAYYRTPLAAEVRRTMSSFLIARTLSFFGNPLQAQMALILVVARCKVLYIAFADDRATEAWKRRLPLYARHSISTSRSTSVPYFPRLWRDHCSYQTERRDRCWELWQIHRLRVISIPHFVERRCTGIVHVEILMRDMIIDINSCKRS